MNEIIKIGKKRTVLVSISILLVSIHTIYFYHAVRPEIEEKKLIQQIIRFLLTSGLLYLIYIGKNWAKKIVIALFTFSIVFACYSLFTIKTSNINKLPLVTMVLVYSFAIYHFLFSKSFEEFQEYQNKKIK
jgi:hypothetical protein